MKTLIIKAKTQNVYDELKEHVINVLKEGIAKKPHLGNFKESGNKIIITLNESYDD